MSEKHELIGKWIEKADHDLGTAMLIYSHIPKYTDTLAFHCQQAVEKYLKAYLFYLDIPFKKTHDLIYLLGLISGKEMIDEERYNNVSQLQDYAVEIRYPDSIIELSNEELLHAIDTAKMIRMFILGKMNLAVKYHDFQ